MGWNDHDYMQTVNERIASIRDTPLKQMQRVYVNQQAAEELQRLIDEIEEIQGKQPLRMPVFKPVNIKFDEGADAGLPVPPPLAFNAWHGITYNPFGAKKPACKHEYVNVSLMHVKLVCKHCDEEKKS